MILSQQYSSALWMTRARVAFSFHRGRVRMAGRKKKIVFLVSALHRDVKWDGSRKVRQGEPEMRTVISVASVLASAFSLDAQITSTLNRLPDGLEEVRIRNNSTTSLVTFVVAVKQAPWSAAASNAPFVVYSDPLIEAAARPLLAGEERVVMANRFVLRGETSPRRSLEEPIVTAGIFADG